MNQYSHFAIEEGDVISLQASANPAEWRLLRHLRVPGKFNENVNLVISYHFRYNLVIKAIDRAPMIGLVLDFSCVEICFTGI